MQSLWNLDCLFASQKELEEKAKKLKIKAEDFEKNYKGKLAQQTDFPMILKQYESLCEGIASIQTYTFLLFAQNSDNGDIYAKYEMICNEIQALLLFFELEFCNLTQDKQNSFIQQSPDYAFYLQQLIAQKKHQLTLDQEQVVLELSPVGVGAFSRFFDEHLSRMRFQMKQNGKKIELGEEEILACLHSANRKERKKAQKLFTEKLQESRHFLTFVLNMIRKDLSIFTKMRQYPRKESFRHIDNCATQKSVDTLIEVVERNYKIVEDYYLQKRELLGVKKLKDYDRYAPISTDKKTQKIGYSEGLELVLQSFEEFSPIFAGIAKQALQEGWIDSHPRDKKRGGAFSHGCVPSAHPFVMLNHTDGRRDVFTIAHEFGHMVHQELSKKQGYLNMDTPLTTAETASVFGEMLLFDTLKNKVDKEELLSLYAGKIEDIFSTLFRQIVMTKFERKIHASEDELKSQDFDAIWIKENQKMFGKSIKLTKNYASWWSYIPHFIHSPFYCYAYSYGQLLVLALFGLYKESIANNKKEEFVKTYIEFLSAGGSRSPRDLIATFGFDIEDERFWEIGIKQIKILLEEFQALK
ncbi:oligoendopeptidase F [Helicobacter enhydrae]|uniref:Oligoendopeptidase F n=1 Tax=Helicobacter enhydrae TaxID=222136 RepID=A0A1B1U4A5_9HELI|nr:M3 family oligoendopeptidase [Helicobacter enhydrae]ANV97535.1 oligoendopeptidase F [Helicobacter enhydrae]